MKSKVPRYPWIAAVNDMAVTILERSPDVEEFGRLWEALGNVVWFLATNGPKAAPEPFDEADGMCPNCCTPWKCNGPHLVDETPYAQRTRP